MLRDRIRVEVYDDDPNPPTMLEHDLARPGGRGLRLISTLQWPEMNDADSEARNRAHCAMSSGSPTRCGIGSGGSWGGQRPSAACYVATDGGQGRGHHPRSAFVLAMLPWDGEVFDRGVGVRELPVAEGAHEGKQRRDDRAQAARQREALNAGDKILAALPEGTR